MTASVPTVQQVGATSVPIGAKSPPPEGLAGQQFIFTLQPALATPVITARGTNATFSSNTITISPSSDIPAGDTIVVGCINVSNNVPGVLGPDSAGNFYTRSNHDGSAAIGTIELYYCLNSKGLPASGTLTYTAPSVTALISLSSVSNVSAVDISSLTAGTSATVAISGTPVSTNEAAFVASGGAIDFPTTPAGWSTDALNFVFSQETSANPISFSAAMAGGSQAWVALMLSFVPTAGASSVSQVYSLNNQAGSGLGMSQVCSMQIDNTQNGNALTITHGAFNQTANIPANSFAIIPTFSSQFTYPFKITPIGTYSTALTVPVTFLNYPVPYGVYIEPPVSPGTVIPNPLPTTGTTAVTTLPNPQPATPTVQRSSGIGSASMNLGFPIAPDQNWTVTGTLNFNAVTNSATYTLNTTILPALTLQGYVITDGMISAAAVHLASTSGVLTLVSATVSLGYSNGGTDIGQFPLGNILSAVSGTVGLISVNYDITVPNGDPVIMTVAITWTNTLTASTTVTGTVTTNAQGIVGAHA